MTTDNKTLADVQPGGMVRLGDQAERARFEAWAHGECLSLHRWPHSGEYSDDRSSSAWKAWQFMLSSQSPPTCQEDVPTAAMIEAAIGAFFKGQQWSSIRDRDAVDVMMREKMRETLQAALSAQPSPGGQGDRVMMEMACSEMHAVVQRAGSYRVGLLSEMLEKGMAALAARQPVGQGDARLLADVDERIATAKALGYEDDIGVGIGLLQCVRSALAARQPEVK